MHQSHVWTAAADVFSFGLVLCELVTGIEPFHDYDDGDAVMRALLRGERPYLPDDPTATKVLWGQCWSLCIRSVLVFVKGGG